MTFEDSFFGVKEEVVKALTKTINLYKRWNDLQAEPITVTLLKEEVEWTTTELRNSLRSIEWDLEDLEDTICIVEKNPSKFKIDSRELSNRRQFIEDTRTEVKSMREKLNFSKGLDADKTSRQPLVDNLTSIRMGGGNAYSNTKYSKLENQTDSPERTAEQLAKKTLAQQNRMVNEQDEHLEMIADSIGTLKNMSHRIAVELDEQDEMLNELHNEIEQTDSRIGSTMQKISKVLHLSNDRSQWIAIGILSSLLVLILVLLIVL